MLRFVVNRLAVVIPTFLGVTVVAFALIRLTPGDPVELLVGERGLDPELVRRACGSSPSPGLAILITVLAFNLVGDGLRDALDPKMKRS